MLQRPMNLKNFNQQHFEIGGYFVQELIRDVVVFSTETFKSMTSNCLTGNKWSFDSSFLFVGSVATTIGYGNVTPTTISGRWYCIIFSLVSIPIFAILLSFIFGVYIE